MAITFSCDRCRKTEQELGREIHKGLEMRVSSSVMDLSTHDYPSKREFDLCDGCLHIISRATARAIQEGRR